MSHTIGQAKQDTQQSNLNQSVQDISMPKVISSEPNLGLSDADYEFLFNQLLEGITHGWHDRRIIKFFARLGDRGQQADWVIWLERLREKLLKLPMESKRPLGTMMIRLGELTQGAPEVSQIGAASHRIGRELLFGNSPAEIWEYAGADLPPRQNQMESPQELSARLPDDFSDLADQLGEKTELEQEIESKSETSDTPALENSVNDNDIDNVVDSLVALLDTEPETDVEEDKPETISQESEGDSGSSTPEKTDLDLDLSLDLDLEPQEPDQVSNDGEELEFELDELEDREVQDSPSPVGAIPHQDLNPKDEKLKLSESPDPVSNALVLEQQRAVLPSPPVSPVLDTSSLELIESWFNLGLKQVSAGEYTEAIASWDRALKINANLPEAWHNRGSALGRLGNYEAAIKSFQSALAIDPNNYQAWNDRAHALYQLENWTGAIESWSQAIKIMPGNHLFWYNRGCALEQIAKWSEAIASYEKALEIKPDFQPGRSRYINLVADNSRPN